VAHQLGALVEQRQDLVPGFGENAEHDPVEGEVRERLRAAGTKVMNLDRSNLA